MPVVQFLFSFKVSTREETKKETSFYYSVHFTPAGVQVEWLLKFPIVAGFNVLLLHFT